MWLILQITTPVSTREKQTTASQLSYEVSVTPSYSSFWLYIYSFSILSLISFFHRSLLKMTPWSVMQWAHFFVFYVQNNDAHLRQEGLFSLQWALFCYTRSVSWSYGLFYDLHYSKRFPSFDSSFLSSLLCTSDMFRIFNFKLRNEPSIIRNKLICLRKLIFHIWNWAENEFFPNRKCVTSVIG